MRSNKKRTVGDKGDGKSFGDEQSSAEFARRGEQEGDADGEPRPLTQPLPYTFLLQEERYLENLDTRCIIQFDDEKFVACVWGTSEIFVIDREKPDAVNSFEVGGGSQNTSKVNLSI